MIKCHISIIITISHNLNQKYLKKIGTSPKYKKKKHEKIQILCFLVDFEHYHRMSHPKHVY